MQYVPLFNNLLVEEISQEDTIITYKENQYNRVVKATVISVGDGEKVATIPTASNGAGESGGYTLIHPSVSAGDVVYFNLSRGREIELESKKYFVINEDDVLVKEING